MYIKYFSSLKKNLRYVEFENYIPVTDGEEATDCCCCCFGLDVVVVFAVDAAWEVGVCCWLLDDWTGWTAK